MKKFGRRLAGQWLAMALLAPVAGTIGLALATSTSGRPVEDQVAVSSDATRSADSATNDEHFAHVARDALGNSVYVWYVVSADADFSADSKTCHIYAQRFNANGKPEGAAIDVVSAAGWQCDRGMGGRAAMSAAGTFAIMSYVNDSVFVQRYDADGSAAGPRIQVSDSAVDVRIDSAEIAMDPVGRFAVVWNAAAYGVRTASEVQALSGIYMRSFDADGTDNHLGRKIADDPDHGTSRTPSVAMNAGHIVVTYAVWECPPSGCETDAVNYVLRGVQIADGASTAFDISSYDTHDKAGAPVSMDPSGAFVVAWQEVAPDTDYPDYSSGTEDGRVYTRVYDPAANPVTGPLRVYQEPVGGYPPAVAKRSSGEFIVTWGMQNPYSYPGYPRWGCYAQQFDALGNKMGAEYELSDLHLTDCTGAVAVDADGDPAYAWVDIRHPDPKPAAVGYHFEVYTRRFSGIEDVDLGMSVSESTDPAPLEGAHSLSYTISNSHASVVPTGISAIDEAIGSATGVNVAVRLPSTLHYAGFGGTHWSCAESSGAITCEYDTALLAGQSSTLRIDTVTGSTIEYVSTTAILSAVQFDSESGNNSATQRTHVGPYDRDPDPFHFTDVTGKPRVTEQVSDTITVTGIDAEAPIHVEGGGYSIGCDGAFQTADGTVTAGQTLCVRHTSASAFGTAVDTTLTIGGVSDTFTSTTLARDITPDVFSFADVLGVEPGSVQTSAPVVIAGINDPAPVHVDGGSYSIGCDGTFTSADGAISAGQSICVRHTANGSFNASTNTTLTVGTVADTFTSTTRSEAPSSGGGSNSGGGGGSIGWMTLLGLAAAGILRRKPERVAARLRNARETA